MDFPNIAAAEITAETEAALLTQGFAKLNRRWLSSSKRRAMMSPIRQKILLLEEIIIENAVSLGLGIMTDRDRCHNLDELLG